MSVVTRKWLAAAPKCTGRRGGLRKPAYTYMLQRSCPDWKQQVIKGGCRNDWSSYRSKFYSWNYVDVVYGKGGRRC